MLNKNKINSIRGVDTVSRVEKLLAKHGLSWWKITRWTRFIFSVYIQILNLHDSIWDTVASYTCLVSLCKINNSPRVVCVFWASRFLLLTHKNIYPYYRDRTKIHYLIRIITDVIHDYPRYYSQTLWEIMHVYIILWDYI